MCIAVSSVYIYFLDYVIELCSEVPVKLYNEGLGSSA